MQPKLCLCLAGGLVFAALFSGNPFLSRGDAEPRGDGKAAAGPAGEVPVGFVIPGGQPASGTEPRQRLLREAALPMAPAPSAVGPQDVTDGPAVEAAPASFSLSAALRLPGSGSTLVAPRAAAVCPDPQLAGEVVDAWQLADGEWIWATRDGKRYRRNTDPTGRPGESVVVEVVTMVEDGSRPNGR
jgi:hypothetical protein